ncbi:hypothetical protein MAR_014805 [Mya arenaria]|uniref:Uncharacterized protein n=1 Tax=Mya arenaria TaxID=6604 RepID=A0ABY7FNN2_MYAAR|nr:hypothetical protein MAR_014805 [Mya arenaria]
MIALLLEANPRLSVRDVKHILIDSSSHLWLEASPEFVPNTAGKYCTFFTDNCIFRDCYGEVNVIITCKPLIQLTLRVYF